MSDPYTDEIKGKLQSAASALGKGQSAEAEQLARGVLGDIPGEAMATQILAAIRIQQRRFDEAITLLKVGLEKAPNNVGLANFLGGAHREKGDQASALPFFQKAAELAPDNDAVFLNLAKTAFDLEDWAEARRGFERVVELAPKNTEAQGGVARLELMVDRADKALELANTGLLMTPDSAVCLQIKAEAHLILGQPQEAMDIADGLAARSTIREKGRILAHSTAADAADKLGQYDAAFSHYSSANDLTRTLFQSQMEPIVAQQSMDRFAGICADLPELAQKVSSWRKDYAKPAPVFFIGFTRSGTTLLQQILTSHSKIVSVETEPLTHAWSDVLHTPEAGTHILALTEERAGQIRERYWQEVERLNPNIPDDGILLDWHPLYSQYLPVIAAVFPDAKIIFAKRDPRDCVLSSFQQNFAMSRSAYQFLGLETAAKFYHDIMSVALATREAFDLNIMDVRYEELIKGVEPHARAAINFLGLEWEKGVLAYRDNAKDNARNNTIKTPSASQVVQPLYTSAAGKWHNYEKHMAPALTLLDPWAERFGYEVG